MRRSPFNSCNRRLLRSAHNDSLWWGGFSKASVNRLFVIMDRKVFIVAFFFLSGVFSFKAFAQENTQLLKDVNAEQLQTVIESYEGEKAVLVNVWATWCIPCVEEFPIIVKLQKMYPEQLQVVFVSLDFPEQRQRVVSFLKEHNVNWTTYLSTDRSSNFMQSLSKKWTGAVPFTKIIDNQGNVVTSWENKADFATFNKYVKQAIKK